MGLSNGFKSTHKESMLVKFNIPFPWLYSLSLVVKSSQKKDINGSNSSITILYYLTTLLHFQALSLSFLRLKTCLVCRRGSTLYMKKQKMREWLSHNARLAGTWIQIFFVLILVISMSHNSLAASCCYLPSLLFVIVLTLKTASVS